MSESFIVCVDWNVQAAIAETSAGSPFDAMLSTLLPATRLLRTLHHDGCSHKQRRSRRRLREGDLADIVSIARKCILFEPRT